MAVEASPQVKRKLLRDRVKLIRTMLNYIYGKAWFDEQNIIMISVIVRIRQNEGEHFLAYSQEEEGRVSYAPKPQYKYDNSHRYKTTLGRYLRRQLGITQEQLSDRYIEQLSYEVLGRLTQLDALPLQIVEGDAITEAYKREVGDSSCMTGGCSRYTDLYALNPDKVKLVIYGNGKKARALLWETDEGKRVLDRIYPNEGSHITTLQEWARSKGYVYRISPHAGETQLSDEKKYHVSLEKVGEYCPYIDTFKYGKYDGDTLTISNDRYFGDFRLERPDGCPPWEERSCCSNCDGEVDEDDAHSTDDGMLCDRCFENNYTYCQRCDDTVARDDSVWIADIEEGYCQHCADRYAIQCNECGDWVKEDYVHSENTDRIYCTSCAEDGLTQCVSCDKYFEGECNECSDGQSRCNDCRKEYEQEAEEETEEVDTTDASRGLASVA